MYKLFKSTALRLMKAPTKPPEPPVGSDGSARVFRAAPKFLTYNLIVFALLSLLSWSAPFILIIAGIADREPAAVIIGILLLPILAVVQVCFYFAVRIDYDMRYYIVTDRSLRVREGAFIVREKTISFANVQNMRVVQGPLLRVLGIWHLKVDTAGGGSGEGGKGGSNSHAVQLAGIENAHEVRDLILGHLRRRGVGAGLGDLDDRAEDRGHSPRDSGEFRAALRELKEATSLLRSVAESRA
jgi:membrane protein YdbS with pleckstrin-like domain